VTVYVSLVCLHGNRGGDAGDASTTAYELSDVNGQSPLRACIGRGHKLDQPFA